MAATETSEECPICLEDLGDPKFLECGHSFCRTCLDKILKSSGKSTCPLCRTILKSQECESPGLEDNLSASDTTRSNRDNICVKCGIVDSVIPCEGCFNLYCEKCLSQHQQYTPPDPNDGFERRLQWKGTVTKFWFHLRDRIVVHKFNPNAKDMLNKNIVVMQPYNRDTFLAASKRASNISMTFPTSNTDIAGVANGSAGRTFLIFKSSNMVYESKNGIMSSKFGTDSFLPVAMSCLNDDRIVLVGKKLIKNNSGLQKTSGSALHVYECNGSLVTDVSLDNGGIHMQEREPTSVCVNKMSNVIYVGDTRQKEIMLFLEDGIYISSYIRNLPQIYSTDFTRIIDLNSSATFPTSLAYHHLCDLLFASYSPSQVGDVSGTGGIYVLSPSLDLLGHFYSADMLGIPSYLSCDDMGRLYVGDEEEGVVRVFDLSEFENKFRRRPSYKRNDKM